MDADHFEHVGYRYRPQPEKNWWFWWFSNSKDAMRMSDLRERGWKVERLYRRCEDASQD